MPTTSTTVQTRTEDHKKKSGNKLNMIIAKTHQLSSRLVGMQLTSGNLIGVLLSMTQMSMGFVFVSSTMTKGIWYWMVAVFGLGCFLAILIERLSIGGLAAVREAKEGKKALEDKFYARAERREPTKWELENKERLVTTFNKDIKAGWWFGAAGMGLSIILGDIFWHQVFGSMEWYEGIPMSLGCASVITLTFVHSELFKGMLDRVIKAILRDLTIMKAAVGIEEQNMQLDMLTSAMATVRDDDALRLPLEAKIGRVVIKRLGGFADNFSDLSIDEENAVEGSAEAPKQIAAPRPRGEYLQRKVELQQFLKDNPGASVGQAATHFNKSKSTMQDWLNKNRAGL